MINTANRSNHIPDENRWLFQHSFSFFKFLFSVSRLSCIHIQLTFIYKSLKSFEPCWCAMYCAGTCQSLQWPYMGETLFFPEHLRLVPRFIQHHNQRVPEVFHRWWSSLGMKLTTHHQLVPKLEMHRPVSQVPQMTSRHSASLAPTSLPHKFMYHRLWVEQIKKRYNLCLNQDWGTWGKIYQVSHPV